MSFFKTKAVILKINSNSYLETKNNGKDLMYTIFSYDFWKIRCFKKFSKKQKNLDLWNIINIEIESKKENSINKMKNVKILKQFKTEDKNYTTINSFLEFLSLITKKTPEWFSNKEIFQVIEELVWNEKIDESKIVLSKLKVEDIFWELKIENENKTIEKILKFINKSKIKDILKLKIEEPLLTELKKLIKI